MYKTDFEGWLAETGRGRRSTRSYSGALGRKLSVFAREIGLTDQNLLSFDDASSYGVVAKALMTHPDFIRFDAVGKRMYSAALNRYSEFLAERPGVAEAELETLMADSSIDRTTRRALIEARVGQGRFRRGVLSYWGQCAVTRTTSMELLVASHIRPWRQSSNVDRLNPFNGILLRPDIDVLFDQGYVTFNREGGLVMSDVHRSLILDFGAREDMRLFKLEDEHRPFLSYHNENVFLG